VPGADPVKNGKAEGKAWGLGTPQGGEMMGLFSSNMISVQQK